MIFSSPRKKFNVAVDTATVLITLSIRLLFFSFTSTTILRYVVSRQVKFVLKIVMSVCVCVCVCVCRLTPADRSIVVLLVRGYSAQTIFDTTFEQR